MANYTFASVTTAVVGIASTTAYIGGSSIFNSTITETNGTISFDLFGLNITSSVPGALTGRRPNIGQLFPRGIYNK
jgi:hypothetical protein